MDYDEIEAAPQEPSHGVGVAARHRTTPHWCSASSARVFVDANASNVPANTLVNELDDELYALNQRLG